MTKTFAHGKRQSSLATSLPEALDDARSFVFTKRGARKGWARRSATIDTMRNFQIVRSVARFEGGGE